MTRARVDYTARTTATATGFNPDTPVEGYYRMRLRSGAMPVGVHIFFGQPLDPETREPLDRSLRWQALVNGRDIDLARVWPSCARDPIDKAEYDFLTRTQEWGQRHAPDSPQANPTAQVNLLTAPLPQLRKAPR